MRWPVILCALPAAMAAPSIGQERPPVIVERWRPGPPPERGAQTLRRAMIEAHDSTRRAARVAPLAWDEALAVSASAYAAELARTGRFEHDRQPADRPPQGENLWMGTRGAYRFAEMAQGWIDERRHSRPGRFPEVSRTGRYGDVGHYTQMIWSRTTRFGCALASNRRHDFLVCRYAPAGNVVGRDPLER